MSLPTCRLMLKFATCTASPLHRKRLGRLSTSSDISSFQKHSGATTLYFSVSSIVDKSALWILRRMFDLVITRTISLIVRTLDEIIVEVIQLELRLGVRVGPKFSRYCQGFCPMIASTRNNAGLLLANKTHHFPLRSIRTFYSDVV